MAQSAARIKSQETPQIPDRLYFRIGDVARICGVETYVLRFWETQFHQLKPKKSGTGQRLYRRHDVEVALEIKRLVHGEGYTISGARQLLESQQQRREPQSALPLVAESVPQTIEEPLSTVAPLPSVPLTSEQPQPVKLQSAEMSALLNFARTELRDILQVLADTPATPSPHRRARVLEVSANTGLLFN